MSNTDWGSVTTGCLPEQVQRDVSAYLDAHFLPILDGLEAIAFRHGFKLLHSNLYFDWRRLDPERDPAA